MKPKLLFVDDENDVLRGLRRAMRPKRHEWDFRFACGGAEALSLMKEDPADIIVTDMRMPEIDGSQLLAEIAEQWPFTRRFVLSGQADSAAVRRLVGTSHQFLGKPFDSQALIGFLENQLIGGTTEQASRILAIQALPSLEQTVAKVRDILRDPNSCTDYAAQVIGDDIALSAKMFQLSNSAYFGTGHATLQPGDAVRTLGIDLLGSLLDEAGFVEPIQRHDPNHVEVNQLLSLATRAAQFADQVIRTFPEHVENPVLFRQLCKFLPLGRLLGCTTGAKHYMDGELCVDFAHLWGFPPLLTESLSALWNKGPQKGDILLAAAVAQTIPGIADLPPSKEPQLEEWSMKFSELASNLKEVA